MERSITSSLAKCKFTTDYELEDFEHVFDVDENPVGLVAIDKKHYGKFVTIPMELFNEGRYLSLKAKWVYATLLSFKNGKTGKTFPSYEAIMRRSGIRRKQDISDALKELVHFNWITKSRNFSKSNDYFIGGGKSHGTVPVRKIDGESFVPLRPTAAEAAEWKKANARKGAFTVEAKVDIKVNGEVEDWDDLIPF